RPASAAATTRGRRATKNPCASTLSAYGIERSNTRDSRIGVLPTSGANRIDAAIIAPNTETTIARRPRMERDGSSRTPDSRARKRHHRQATGARMTHDVGVDAIQRPDRGRIENLLRWSVPEHAPALEE